MKNILSIITLIIVLVTVFIVIADRPEPVMSLGGVAQATVLTSATTTTSIAVTSSTRILATTTNTTDPTNSHPRAFATICNPTATLVYLNMNQDRPADLSNSQVIIAGAAGYQGCYEITDKNLYSGSVQASSTNQTSVSLIISDYVQ